MSQPTIQDARMEISLILTQWSMPEDLRTALNHLKSILDSVGLPNPSMPFSASEPDMTHMGAKHIKECRGCDALILWAKHVKADGSIGKAAPLVKAKKGEKPNIIAWFDEAQDQWFYKIKGTKNDAVRGGVPEYVNHFSNCERSKDFRAAPKTEDEARQLEIR